MADIRVEIICSACGAESFLKRSPLYDGFKKVGEQLVCVACGHVFADESEVRFRQLKRPAIFTDEDKPRAVTVFNSNEKNKSCRHCKHYVVNPFTQRCGRHQRVVEATDLCGDFDPGAKTPDQQGG